MSCFKLGWPSTSGEAVYIWREKRIGNVRPVTPPGTRHQMPQGSARATSGHKGMTSRRRKQANGQWGIRKGASECRSSRKCKEMFVILPVSELLKKVNWVITRLRIQVTHEKHISPLVHSRVSCHQLPGLVL